MTKGDRLVVYHTGDAKVNGSVCSHSGGVTVQCFHPVHAEAELRVSRLFTPERAVIVEDGNAFRRCDKARVAFGSRISQEREDGLGRPFIPGRQVVRCGWPKLVPDVLRFVKCAGALRRRQMPAVWPGSRVGAQAGLPRGRQGNRNRSAFYWLEWRVEREDELVLGIGPVQAVQRRKGLNLDGSAIGQELDDPEDRLPRPDFSFGN